VKDAIKVRITAGNLYSVAASVMGTPRFDPKVKRIPIWKGPFVKWFKVYGPNQNVVLKRPPSERGGPFFWVPVRF